MFQLDFRNPKPLYEQIKDNLRFLIISKSLQENSQIPSVRDLAIELTINPNTIQKAYKDLEQEGFIYSIKGRGNFVSAINKNINNERISVLEKDIKQIITELKYTGLGEKEILDLIKNILKESEVKINNG